MFIAKERVRFADTYTNDGFVVAEPGKLVLMPRSVKGDILYPFATLSLVAVFLFGAALALLFGGGIEARMRDSAVEVSAATLTSALQPHIVGLDLQSPLSSADYERLQQELSQHTSGETLRLRVYNRDGVAVYSSEPGEAGQLRADSAALQSALSARPIGEELSSEEATAQGNLGSIPVLKVYAPLYSANHQVVATMEAQQNYSATASAVSGAKRSFYLNLTLGLLGLYGVLQLGMWGVTRALAKDHKRLAYLYQTGEHVRSSLDMQEVLSQIVRDSALLAQAPYSMVCLSESESGGLVARATYDQRHSSVALHRREVDEWLFHRVLATGETKISGHWKVDYRRVFCMDVGETPMSVVCVPMKLRNKVTGVIVVLRRASGEGFSRAEAQILEELAAQAAMAVEQANLFAKVRAYASELEVSYESTLKALSGALDAKDAATEGHCERVADLTLAIAREMEVPEEKLVDIKRGALLHDVGKIGVPDAVLRKPRDLTTREWQTMQRHPLLAGVLVSKIGFLEGALPILLYHHERFDGKGYPFGLATDRIPLEARIFAVVDAYDAMTSDRPYRKAILADDAVQEIIANSGTQFDPAVVESFLRVVEHMPLVQEDAPQSRDEEAA